MNKVWLITGCSRGLGRAWAAAALERGDQVVATARVPDSLRDLESGYGRRVAAVRVDVRDRASVHRAFGVALDTFGRVDVVVNNAGYGMFCPLEDVPEDEAQALWDTNVAGSLRVLQEALPILRGQGRGHIVQISSIAGLLALPDLGMYNATKWAVEGMVESLASEIRPFGIKVTLVEPGPHRTDWIGSSSVRPLRTPAYPSHQDVLRTSWPAAEPAAATETVAPMMRLVDSDDPPLRLLLGNGLEQTMKETYGERLNVWGTPL